MKLDQETLIKHRFWIALGVFLPLWLIAMIVLITGVSGSIEAKRVDYEKSKKDLGGAQTPKGNANFLNPLEEKKKTLEEQKQLLWEKNWQAQADMMTWPGQESKDPIWRHLMNDGRYGEKIEHGSLLDFPNLYKTQFVNTENEIPIPVEIVYPVEFKGGWESQVPRVTWEKIPTAEEAWLAQENWWVQKELLVIIRSALDAVSRFDNAAYFKKIDDSTESLPQGVVQRLRFKNLYWELDVLLGRNDRKQWVLDPKSSIKNISVDGRPRPLSGVQLIFQQKSAKSGLSSSRTPITLEGKKLSPGETAPLTASATPLTSIRDLNALEIVMDEDKANPLPTGVVGRQRFHNPNWLVELLFEEDDKKQLMISTKSTIKNIHPNKRTLALRQVELKIDQGSNRGGPPPFQIPSDPVPWNRSAPLCAKPIPVPTFTTNQPVNMEQIFNWYTLPIKRIDAIRFGTADALSHRMAMNRTLKKAKGLDHPGDPAKGGQKPANQGQGMGRGGENADNAEAKSANGLDPNRFLASTDQVRSLPVALVVIVDQAHMQDVETALVNSRLGIQITQHQWRHAHGIKPTVSQDAKPPKPVATGNPSPRSGRGGRGGRFPFGRSPFQPRMPSGVRQDAVDPDEEDPNLVEFAVYGIASLYERYPPPGAPADANQGAGGGAPPGRPR